MVLEKDLRALLNSVPISHKVSLSPVCTFMVWGFQVTAFVTGGKSIIAFHLWEEDLLFLPRYLVWLSSLSNNGYQLFASKGHLSKYIRQKVQQEMNHSPILEPVLEILHVQLRVEESETRGRVNEERQSWGNITMLICDTISVKGGKPFALVSVCSPVHKCRKGSGRGGPGPPLKSTVAPFLLLHCTTYRHSHHTTCTRGTPVPNEWMNGSSPSPTPHFSNHSCIFKLHRRTVGRKNEGGGEERDRHAVKNSHQHVLLSFPKQSFGVVLWRERDSESANVLLASQIYFF